MRINADITNREIELAMHWLAGLIGGPLIRRVEGFERRERLNPMLASYFRENFPAEHTLVKAIKYSRKTGRFPTSPEYDLAWAFVVNAHRIYWALLDDARTTFSGRLRDAANNQHGARPLAFEIGMAVHLMRQGWEVDFADYSGIAQFDFVACRQGVEIEVELKSTSGDAGRKIHRKEMNRLADLILPTTTRILDTQGCHLLRVTIPDRLPADESDLTKIAALVAKAAESKSGVSDDLCNINYEHPNISDWPDPRGGKEPREFFETLFDVSNQHIIFCGQKRFSVVAVLVERSAPNQVLNALADQVKQAADQCTGQRPAVIVLQLGDPIDRAELEILANTPSGLHTIAGEVFDDSKRLHVYSIAFTVPQEVGETRQPSAPVATLFNPNPLYPCPDARTIFRSNS